MADSPARRDYDPSAEQSGWGSPMPAEYGSLTAFLPPLDDSAPRDPGTRRAERRGNERRTDGRGKAPKAGPATDGADRSPNGASAPTSEVPLWAPPATDGAAAGAAAADIASPVTRPGGAQQDGSGHGSGPAARTQDPLRGPAPVTRDPLRGPATTVMPAPPVPIVPVVPSDQPQRTLDEPVEKSTRESLGSRRHQRKVARAQWAQSKRTIRHLNVWTVLKVSLAFYFMLLVAVVVASIMLWYVADALGSIQTIEKSVKTLFDLSTFTIHPGEVVKYTAIGGAGLAICGTFANVLAAFMYNLISDLVGGLRFDVVDEGL